MAPDLEYYFARYGDIELHRRMIQDRVRTDAFARALAQVIQSDSRVLDVGTGTGILAMLAARAGAAEVFGIEQSEVAQTAANLVKQNGLSKRVRILRGPAAEVVLDGPVDVIVSEWLGNLAFVEGMLDDVLTARDKNLARDGRMIPSQVSVLVAPVDDPVLYGLDGPGFWRRPIHGLDFSSLEERELEQGRSVQLRVEAPALLAPGQSLVDVELTTAEPDDRFAEGERIFVTQRDGVLSGFVGWFVAELAPGVWLDTGPGQPETHWAQTYMSFRPQPVRRGDELSVQFKIDRHPTEPRYLSLRLRVAGHTQVFRVE